MRWLLALNSSKLVWARMSSLFTSPSFERRASPDSSRLVKGKWIFSSTYRKDDNTLGSSGTSTDMVISTNSCESALTEATATVMSLRSLESAASTVCLSFCWYLGVDAVESVGISPIGDHLHVVTHRDVGCLIVEHLQLDQVAINVEAVGRLSVRTRHIR